MQRGTYRFADVQGASKLIDLVVRLIALQCRLLVLVVGPGEAMHGCGNSFDAINKLKSTWGQFVVNLLPPSVDTNTSENSLACWRSTNMKRNMKLLRACVGHRGASGAFAALIIVCAPFFEFSN